MNASKPTNSTAAVAPAGLTVWILSLLIGAATVIFAAWRAPEIRALLDGPATAASGEIADSSKDLSEGEK